MYIKLLHLMPHSSDFNNNARRKRVSSCAYIYLRDERNTKSLIHVVFSLMWEYA